MLLPCGLTEGDERALLQEWSPASRGSIPFLRENADIYMLFGERNLKPSPETLSDREARLAHYALITMIRDFAVQELVI